ncbi:MAG: selenocysteine-specific elongation factor [Hyphomicrobiales bacterium]|nr:selenocysteine-specific elongation factor [Hyphomicrobiales bacterium]
MIIGTAGHIDHGKTSLTRALTGVDADRLKEEKARGISIDLGFAYLPAPDGQVLGFVDVPGHEKFVHNMLAGATGIDFVLLTIVADDGVMPQTLEHLAIVDLLGITHGIVALTKADVASAERRAEVTTEIENALLATGLAGAEVLPVSVVSGEGIEELRERLFAAARDIAPRAPQGRFRLAVDRSFTLAGAGTVVTGTVLSGAVNVGDRVGISPSGLSARVRSIHAQNRPAARGEAGQRCALNLAGDGITKDSIARGHVVLDPELHAPTGRIDAMLRVLGTEQKPVTQWMPVRLHHAAADVAARVVLLGDTPVAPGTEAHVQLVLDQPIAAAVNDRFVLRDTTAQRTIAGGRFLDLRAPARKRRTPERLAQLEAHAIIPAEAALGAMLDRAPWFADLTAFARDRALAAPQIDALVESGAVIRIAGTLGLSPAVWLRFRRALTGALEAFHKDNPDLAGIGLERLRLQLEPRLPAPKFSIMLQGLARAHEIALDGAWVKLPGHEVRLTPSDEKLWSTIRPMLSAAERFRPPRVRDIANLLGAPEADVRRLLKLLGRMGKVDEVAHDHFFLRGTVAEMVEIAVDIAAHADNNQFIAAQFRDRLDNGRKIAIQILEFFDRHGVTLRRGDLRRLSKHRLDLFRRPADETPEANSGRESSLVGRPDFKSGRGRETVLGGFDSLSLPPHSRSAG